LQATNEAGKTGAHLILEGDHVNTHVTTAGAVMALALMFLKSNNSVVATGLLTPDTLYQLEAIRPDFLLLRVRAARVYTSCAHICTGIGSQFDNVGLCNA